MHFPTDIFIHNREICFTVIVLGQGCLNYLIFIGNCQILRQRTVPVRFRDNYLNLLFFIILSSGLVDMNVCFRG